MMCCDFRIKDDSETRGSDIILYFYVPSVDFFYFMNKQVLSVFGMGEKRLNS